MECKLGNKIKLTNQRTFSIIASYYKKLRKKLDNMGAIRWVLSKLHRKLLKEDV